jgi:uncharacterized membrane protein YtjA (UPF0391 family)
MIRWAVTFFIAVIISAFFGIAIIAALLGLSTIAVSVAGVTKILFYIFLLFFIFSLFSGKAINKLNGYSH